MKRISLLFVILLTVNLVGFAQQNPFQRLHFLLGNWEGTGVGFGNDQSTIQSSFKLVLNNQYIEVTNDSRFEPTNKNPQGEHHTDRGMISYDSERKKLVFRQFNSEGYINQYVLVDSLSLNKKLVFETEKIENFVPGGKARWTIEKKSDDEIETNFFVTFPGHKASCFGSNKLKKVD